MSTARTTPSQNIYFIDSGVDNYASIVAALPAGTEVHILTAAEPGLEQIATVLAGRSEVDAISLISHGTEGQLALAGDIVTRQELATSAETLARIGNALSDTADILLYGCNVAKGEKGLSFIDTLSQLTGADIAASDNLTGSAAQGADWVLEQQTGQIDAQSLAYLPQLASYQGTLAGGTLTFNNFGVNDSAGSGFKTLTGTNLVVNNDAEVTNGTPGIYYSGTLDSGNPTHSFTFKVDGTNWGSFDLTDVTLHMFSAFLDVSNLVFTGTKAADGSTVTTTATHDVTGNNEAPKSAINNLDTGADFSSFTGISELKLDITFTSTTTNINNFEIDGLTYSAAYAPSSNTAPTITLDDSSGGDNFSTSWTEGNASPAIADTDSDIVDTDSDTEISTVIVTLTNDQDGAAEYLTSTVVNGNVTVSNNNTDTITLTNAGSATTADFEAVLEGIQWTNTSDSPDTTNRTVTVVANDGTDNSNTATTTISVSSTNDAPVLADTTVTLTGVSEDAGDDDGSGADGDNDATSNADNSGDTVADLLTAAITDADGSAVEAIAVTNVDNTNGVWQYSTDAGSNWTNFSGTTGSSADLSSASRLLDSANKVRFVPDGDYSGTATFTFRAWDKSSGSIGGTADTTTNGTTTAFSTTTDTAEITVNAVEDAPTVTSAPASVTVSEDIATAIDLSAAVIADVDTTGDITVTITATDTSAALTAADGAYTTVTETATGNNVVTLVGTAANITTYLDTASNITYKTSSNNTAADTLTIKTDDGETGIDTNAASVTVNITSINDEPTASATGDNSSAAGGGSAVSVFSSTAISAVDTSEDIASVTFTVSGLVDTGNEKLNYDGTAIDLLTDTSGLYANTTTSGLISYAVAVSGSTATVTFKGPVEAAAANTVFQTALDGMTYENTLGAVTTGDRVFTLTEVKDAGGTANSGDDTLAASIASTITVVNGDTPTATNATKAATEDTPFTMTTSEIVLTQEANTTDALEFITLGTINGGTLAFTGAATTAGTTSSGGSGAVTLVDAAAALTAGQHVHVDNIANIQFTPTADSTTSGSVLYTVTDAGGDASGSATLAINLAAVEDAPTLTGVTTTITALEDTVTNLVTGSPVFADIDTSADVVATLTAADGSAVLTASDASGVVVGNSGNNAITLTGTADEINTFLATPANITYTGSVNNVTADSVVISVADGEGGTDANATTLTVNFTPVNDAPAIIGLSGDSVSTNIGGSEYIDDQGVDVADITDIDSTDLDSGYVLITQTSGTTDGSFLSDTDDETIKFGTTEGGADGTPAAGDSVWYNDSSYVAIGTVDNTNTGQNGADFQINFHATSTPAAAGYILSYLKYSAATEGTRTFSATVNDGDGETSVAASFTVNVIDNTKPVATSYTDSDNEDTPINLSATELPTSQDSQDTPDALEYITIDTSTVVGGVLSLDSAGSAGTSTVGAVAYDVTAGSLTGTVNINIADIGKLDFTPSDNLSGAGAASFDWTVTDAGGHTSPTATYTLDITNVSDDPAGADKSISITTGATHTFSASDFGFTDADTGDTLNRVQVNVQTIDNGALKLSDVTVSDGDWINLVDIGNLVYTPSAAGADTFTFTVEDSTNATDSTPNTVTINTSVPPSSGGGGSTPTPTPAPTTETIDGAVVTTTEETDDSGNVVSVISIAPVTAGRADSDATTSQADVPLHFADDAGTDVVTTISLPTGVGIAARANDTAHSRNTLDDLISLINETAGGTESSHSDMVSGGESFLETLSANNGDSTLWVNQVTLTSDGSTAPDTAIKVTGSISSNQSNFQEALVIDTRQLPSGSLLELDDIEFAVIVGDGVTIRGGEGRNTIFAGEGSQNIVLGADDDLLHGGSGDDTVGSRGGDDLLFGDAGNDTLFGGEGSDQLHGGLDSDLATYDGNFDDYNVIQAHGVVTVSRKDDPTDADTLINIEQIQFADRSITPVYDTQLQAIATLYDHVLERQADLAGFQFWGASNETRSLGQIALDFLMSNEYQQSQNIQFDQLSQASQVEQLYLGLLNRSSDADGKAFWLNALDSGASIAQVADSFVTSAELNPQYLEANSWNFFV